MSPRPSRIHRNRKRGQWREQLQPECEACLDELPRLPVCFDDDEEALAVTAAASSAAVARSAVPIGGGEAPVKLRHLKVAAERGHLEAMYLMAQECDDRVERIQWLTMAAERGHVPAMHDLGLASVALHAAAAGPCVPRSTAGPRPWPNWGMWSARDLPRALIIADLDKSDGARQHHVKEAINCRMLDWNLWPKGVCLCPS